MALSAPVELGSGGATGSGTSWATEPISPVGDSTVVLFLMTGGRNPLVGELPLSVSGVVDSWTLIGSDTSFNTRVRLSAYIGTAVGSGDVSLTFGSEAERVAYRIVGLPGAAPVPVQSEVRNDSREVTLNPLRAGTMGLGAFVLNSMSGTPEPGSGYTSVGNEVLMSAPSGGLSVAYSLPGNELVEFTTEQGAGYILIGMEIAPEAESSDPGTYLVMGGLEVPATIRMVRGGVEVPASFQLV